MKWVVGNNTPGFLPDAEPEEYPTWESAKAGLLAMLNDVYDAMFERGRPVPGTALAYVQTRAEVCAAREMEPFTVIFRGRVYWLADVGRG